MLCYGRGTDAIGDSTTNADPLHAGEQEADSGELQQVVVNRLKLMRKRIDARDRESEIRVEFIGNPEDIGLKAEPKQVAVTGVRAGRLLDLEIFDVCGTERDGPEALPTFQESGPIRLTVTTRTGSPNSASTMSTTR